ncbi:unnamed protein product [Alternaria alternata]
MRNMFGFLHRPPNTKGPFDNTERPTTSRKSAGSCEASPSPVPSAPSVLPSPSLPAEARQTRKGQRSHPTKRPQVLAGNTAPSFRIEYSGKKVARSSDVASKSVSKPLGLAGKKVSKLTPTRVIKKTANRVKPGVAIKYNYDADKAPIFRGHVTRARAVTNQQYLKQEVKAIQITAEALDIVHKAIKEIIVCFFITGQIIAQARKVKTVTPADLKTAAKAARILSPYSRLLEEHDFGDPEQRGYVLGPISSSKVVSPLRP